MLPAIQGWVAALVGAVRTRVHRVVGAPDRSHLVEALDAAAVRVDGSGRVVDVNRRATAVLDVRREGAVGRPLGDVAPPLAAVEDPDGTVVELPVDGEPRRFAVSVPTRGASNAGEGAAVEQTGAGAAGTDGRWLLLRAVTDVERRRPAAGPTEEEGSAAATEEGSASDAPSSERPPSERFLGAIPTGVLLLDGTGAVVAGNERGAVLLGTDLASLRGTTVEELERRGVVGAGFPDGRSVPGGRVDAEGAVGRGPAQVTVRPADGDDERVLEVRLGLRPGEADGGAVCLLRDVTDRQRRVDELEQYEAIVEVLPDPVYATDAEGRLTFVNRAFEEQLGSPGADAGEHFSEYTTAEDTETVLALLREMVGEGGPDRATAEISVLTRDGRQLRVEDSIALLPGDDAFRGSAGVLRDVTERRRRQEVLTVMNRALRHNLRTNVATIVGYADLLDREVDGEAETFVDRIRGSADWLATLGDTLRTLQQAIEANVAGDVGVDVEDVVESVVADAREDHPGADLAVHVATTGALEAGWPLEYALENVVENAIVHSDRSEPAVDVWIADAPREGWVDIHVEDDGPGVPPDERDVVVGDAAITQLQHGSGLGLWLTRWLVEVFDGELVIEDNDPRGTVVTLRLPRAAAG